MPRKPRPDPYSEGSIRTIYEWFFGPLVRYKPDHFTIKDWLEELFHLRHRDIVRYRTLVPFRMPGHYRESALKKVQGIGYREVGHGDTLYVRFDALSPNEVDVEILSGVGQKDQVFVLSRAEWESISRLCEVSEQ